MKGILLREKCRVCGAGKEMFYSLIKEDAKKIYAPDRTNDIHMEIVKLAMQMNYLAQEGIEIGYDADCVALFKEIQEEAWKIKVKCKKRNCKPCWKR